MAGLSMMRVVETAGFGGPEVLRLAYRPIPVPAPGEVLVRVTASGINRPDVLQRKGLYAPPPGVSDVPGLEVAGVIQDGDDSELSSAGLAKGMRVCALVAGGGYAEYCLVPVGQCLPVPSGWTDVEAASLPETFFTVWSNLFDRVGLRAGESLLIHGGGSGIGVTATQLAKALGVGPVFVTVGEISKAARCRSIGADVVIHHRTEDFVERILSLTGGRGVDVILDMVAGPYVERNIRALADDGRCAVIAVQGGTSATLDAGALLRRRLTLTGSTLRARSVAFKSSVAQQLLNRVWPLMASGAIRPVVDQVFAPEAAARAHARMESGVHFGKLVINWGSPT